MLRIFIIIFALVSTITMDAQKEVIGGYVKKDGTESGINATSRFPMYSVMKFPQALYVADFLIRNNIELNTEVMVWKDELLQDTWSPMLKTFENQRTFTYSELLTLSLQQSDNNACDILFERCGGPRKVEQYIRKLGFKDIRIQKTEKQMHERPTDSSKNWCTPQSMAALHRVPIAIRSDIRHLRCGYYQSWRYQIYVIMCGRGGTRTMISSFVAGELAEPHAVSVVRSRPNNG